MRRGGGRSAVLLGAVATLLLISSSAVSGLLDENVQKVGRFADRRERTPWEADWKGYGSNAQRVFAVRAEEELKPSESVEVVDEKNPAVSGILDENVQKVGRFAERRERTRSHEDWNSAQRVFFGRAGEELKPSESVEVVDEKNPAVSGILDENVHKVGRFAERRERAHRRNGDVVHAQRWAAARARGRTAEDLKRSESAEVVDEKKPANGVLERARSFLSGLAASVRHGISNPTAFLWEKKHRAAEEAEKAFGRKGFVFGGLPEPEITVHHEILTMPSSGTIESVRQSRRAGIRDVNRIRAEILASAAAGGVSATEVLAQDGDATPELGLRSKIMGLVTSVVEEYNAGIVDPNLDTCADVLETQVKILVKSVRSALQERICNGDVASKEGRSFCNVFDNDPTMGTFQSLWMTQINPLDVVWHQTSKTDVCSSGNPLSSFLKSLEEMEGMVHQFDMKHYRHDMSQSVVRDHREYERKQSLWYAGERHEHEDHERHLGQQMSNKEMKHHPFEEKHEHGNHQKYGWKGLFGMLRHQKQKEHLGFKHGHEISAREVCFFSNVRHLSKGRKQYLASTCETTTNPDVIAACKFAKEHHFLVKVWLALKTPVWFKAAKSCTPSFEGRHTSDLEISRFGSVVRKTLVDGGDGLKKIGMTKERQLTTLPPWTRSGCARNLAKRGFSKALNLRGHVNDIKHVDGGVQGLVRTDFIILAIDGHEVQDVLKNLRSLDHSSSEDALTDFQALEDVRRAVQDEHEEHDGRPGLKSETIVRRPFHHHVNFRVSANPRELPQLEGPRFRISAMPRVVRDVNTEMPVIGPNDVIDDVAGDSETVIETQLNKYSRDTAENRADM